MFTNSILWLLPLPTLHNTCYSGPLSPTGVSSVASDSSTVVVSWNPAFSGMCDVFARDYTVRYRLYGCSGSSTTVNISGTSVTLRGLVPNEEYGVEVAAINSNGDLSDFSTMSQFTVTPTTAAPPSKTLLPLRVTYISICSCKIISITFKLGKLFRLDRASILFMLVFCIARAFNYFPLSSPHRPWMLQYWCGGCHWGLRWRCPAHSSHCWCCCCSCLH